MGWRTCKRTRGGRASSLPGTLAQGKIEPGRNELLCNVIKLFYSSSILTLPQKLIRTQGKGVWVGECIELQVAMSEWEVSNIK